MTASARPSIAERGGHVWPSRRTRPEDVFLAWLLTLPSGADVAQAARREIARLDRAAPLDAGPERLRQLMMELVEAA